jgi:2-amino-4-ketopentanoate thiolase beta subunit
VIVVQETEYTGAGKHPYAQLGLAKRMGVEVRCGDPGENEPGRRIVIPEHPSQLRVRETSLDELRRSYLRNVKKSIEDAVRLEEDDVQFLAEDTRASEEFVRLELERES